MLDRLLVAISDIPVLVQGALGSALFALCLYLGQRVAEYSMRRAASLSVERRKRYLIEERIRYNVLVTKDFAERGAYVSLLLFRALRSLFKALIWLALGLASAALIDVLSVVGYAGALYYLFAGLATLAPPTNVPDYAAKLAEINAELEELEKKMPRDVGEPK